MKEALTEAYNLVLSWFPPNLQIIPPLVLFALGITFYGIFVWLFYRFLAKRDLIKLNLKKYNVFELAWVIKIVAVIFYIIEFIVILPFVILFWFSVLSALLIVLIKGQPVASILLISASVIGAVRITSYFREDLARDLAKMFPFTLLSVALLTPGFFDLSTTFDRFLEIPELFNYIIYYAVFIIIIEAFFRVLFILIHSVTSVKKEEVPQEAAAKQG